MLRKRNRSIQKDQHIVDSSLSQSDILAKNHRMNSFFSLPGVLVGFNPKNPSDCDAIRSPTSPLDFRVLSNLGNPFRSPRVSPQTDVKRRSWDSDKVGLSIIDSLDDKRTGKILRSSESKNIIFGSQMRMKNSNPKSHLTNCDNYNDITKMKHANVDVLARLVETQTPESEEFENFQSCSLGSRSSKLPLTDLDYPSSRNISQETFSAKNTERALSSQLISSLSASEIELSEDYTRITSHGSNPKTTHIFCDCILECHSTDIPNSCNNVEFDVNFLHIWNPFSAEDFLSFCFHCKKRLEGSDIYMYRGEKAFCSLHCRWNEIEKTCSDSSKIPPEKNNIPENPESGIFIAV